MLLYVSSGGDGGKCVCARMQGCDGNADKEEIGRSCNGSSVNWPLSGYRAIVDTGRPQEKGGGDMVCIVGYSSTREHWTVSLRRQGGPLAAPPHGVGSDDDPDPRPGIVDLDPPPLG